MSNSTASYSAEKIALPEGFVAKTTKIATGIVVFFIIYLLFLAVFSALLFYSLLFSLEVLSRHISIIAILLFIGVNGFLGMIVLFLFKIFFREEKKDESDTYRIEIFPKDQPELFALIYEVADRVNTYRPRRVFLLPDVNASVFHEQNLLSLMLSPSKQNLNIGLGLVSILSVSELKSVLAHEFGHFSQNATRLSGFIYKVNRLIIELLYTDSGWNDTLRQGASISSITSIFAVITIYTARGIKWIFQKIYETVNLSHMSLSRDLEFHADAVAVSITGKEPMKTALRKLDFGAAAYEATLTQLNELLQKEKKCTNAYELYHWQIEDLAVKNKLEIKHRQPVITEEHLKSLTTSRVYYKDQWASHPSLAEREKNFESCTMHEEQVHNNAWTLFRDPAVIQEKMTEILYLPVAANTEKNYQQFASDELLQEIAATGEKTKINTAFNNFYNRFEYAIDIDQLLEKYNPQQAALLTFEQVYAPGHIKRKERLWMNKSDSQLLQAIKNKQINTTYFEFDNVKYKRNEAERLDKQLQKEISDEEQITAQCDADSFYFNLYHAKQRGEDTAAKLIMAYREFLAAARLVDITKEYYTYFGTKISLFSQQVADADDQREYLTETRRYESEMKEKLKHKDLALLIDRTSMPEVKESLERYRTEATFFYLNLYSITSVEVEKLFDFLTGTNKVACDFFDETLKNLTEMQLLWAPQNI